MDTRTLCVCARTARIAAAAVAVFMLAGCNFPQPSSSNTESPAAGDQYSSEQQALEGVSESDFLKYATGCRDNAKWYLCIETNLKVMFYSPPGEVAWKVLPGESPCAEMIIHGSSTSRFSKSVKLEIKGEAEDEDKKCTWKGSSSVTVMGTGWCEGSADRGAFYLTVKQTWAANAPTTLTCVSKPPDDNDLPPQNIDLGTLGEQTFDMTLQTWKSQQFAQYQCKTFPMLGGPLSGELKYCLYNASYYQPVDIPVEMD